MKTIRKVVVMLVAMVILLAAFPLGGCSTHRLRCDWCENRISGCICESGNLDGARNGTYVITLEGLERLWRNSLRFDSGPPLNSERIEEEIQRLLNDEEWVKERQNNSATTIYYNRLYWGFHVEYREHEILLSNGFYKARQTSSLRTIEFVFYGTYMYWGSTPLPHKLILEA